MKFDRHKPSRHAGLSPLTRTFAHFAHAHFAHFICACPRSLANTEFAQGITFKRNMVLRLNVRHYLNILYLNIKDKYIPQLEARDISYTSLNFLPF